MEIYIVVVADLDQPLSLNTTFSSNAGRTRQCGAERHLHTFEGQVSGWSVVGLKRLLRFESRRYLIFVDLEKSEEMMVS